MALERSLTLSFLPGGLERNKTFDDSISNFAEGLDTNE